jgi:hypothetical protein
MVVNPRQPEAAQLPAEWDMAFVFGLMAFLVFCGFLMVLFK